jgi:hypothetical protein
LAKVCYPAVLTVRRRKPPDPPAIKSRAYKTGEPTMAKGKNILDWVYPTPRTTNKDILAALYPKPSKRQITEPPNGNWHPVADGPGVYLYGGRGQWLIAATDTAIKLTEVTCRRETNLGSNTFRINTQLRSHEFSTIEAALQHVKEQEAVRNPYSWQPVAGKPGVQSRSGAGFLCTWYLFKAKDWWERRRLPWPGNADPERVYVMKTYTFYDKNDRYREGRMFKDFVDEEAARRWVKAQDDEYEARRHQGGGIYGPYYGGGRHIKRGH